ncbi:MoaD/ThiS family protein [Marinihelvus fidelis]|nr:MoaD/ThiS family protein [Marinihelvus fidelis]
MSDETAAVRVTLPHHLRMLSGAGAEVTLDVSPPVSVASVLDALEARYPMLRGMVREHVSGERRAKVRFFACRQDVTHLPLDTALPAAVANGDEPLMIIAAISGG